MKKILCLFCFSILFASKINAQISLNATYTLSTTSSSPVDFYLTKFSNLGYKYILEDHIAKTIKIYNLNNSLYLNITIPNSAVGTGPYTIFYLSDNLFDLNNDIEYLLSVTSGTPGIPSLYVFKDNGTQMFYKDSVTLIASSAFDVFKNTQNIWYDGTGTKMQIKKMQRAKWEVYNLPGVLPCIQCSSTGTTVGRPEYQGNTNSEAIFYPNPVKDQIKLKYNLPKDFKTAEIKIQDVQGKLIETFKVGNDFDFIYVPSNYNNGLYLYSLVVDGKMIKTEKIVLSKD